MKLYFTKGTTPTPEEQAEAKVLGITAFRNASKHGAVETKVEAVAGEVPAAYLKNKKIQVLGEAAKRVPAPAKKPAPAAQ